MTCYHSLDGSLIMEQGTMTLNAAPGPLFETNITWLVRAHSPARPNIRRVEYKFMSSHLVRVRRSHPVLRRVSRGLILPSIA